MKNSFFYKICRKLLIINNYYFYDYFFKQWLSSVLSLLVLFVFPKLFGLVVNFVYRDVKISLTRDNVIEETENLFDDFIVKVSGIKQLDEVNIIMKGQSYDRCKNNVDFSLPTFYVNFLDNEINNGHIHMAVDEASCNLSRSNPKSAVIYIGNDIEVCKKLHYNQGESLIYKKDEPLIACVAHKSGVANLQLGSGLSTIVLLNSISNKINIYGWDSYLNTDIGNMSTFEYLSYLKSVPNNTFFRHILLITEKVLNFIYAYRISFCDHINIYSYFSSVNAKKDLYKKYRYTLYR
jgi:hypothetical protein